LHRIGIGLIVRSRDHAEVTGFWVDRPEPTVWTDAHPRDVITDGVDLPPIEALGRDHHREVGFSAGAGEGCSDVGGLAFWGFNAENQHVLGEPTFGFTEVRSDAKREALLPEKHVAAVARSIGPDRIVFGEVADV